MKFLLATAIAASVLVVGVLAIAGALQGEAPVVQAVVRAETPRSEPRTSARDVTLAVPPEVERGFAPIREEMAPVPEDGPAEARVEETPPSVEVEEEARQRRAADERLAQRVARIAREARLGPPEKERVHLVLAEEGERQRRAYEDYRKSATDAHARGQLIRDLKELRLWKERELEAWLGEDLARVVLAPRMDDARGPEQNPSRRNP